ncbi:dihydroorotate dehydrogenase [Miniphocaeibacter halophilus]|uniref:Dihydroorotate dehydrogenase n=1 Tax=Miniphocaeibacter halophilus TaxID=2931922 RepID=A0AC61MQ97_9FIRM|nr:dihydroorotate dehydrogenase [Miniphocaeibacter halophilus]QQK07697.1 dihydroorotate dehydrogenase [Miniphocaeibacter halophilus]
MLKVNICGVEFNNPVIAASGTFGFGREFEPYVDLNKIGGISTKGLTYYKKDGNEGRRIHETASGIMNSIGLQNPSVSEFIKNDLDFMKQFDAKIIANIGGSQVEDYLKSIELIEETDIEIIELNISCPNVKEGGMAFGIKCDIAFDIVKKVREKTNKVLMVKLSPNAENIKEMAISCVEAGADSLSLVNTFNALAIDIYKRKPIFKNVTAGLSGPAIKPIALRMVKEVHDVVDVPIVGMGGIMDWQDAIEFIMAGSTAVQVGTANFIQPNIMEDIIDGIERFMIKENIKDLSEITGII